MNYSIMVLVTAYDVKGSTSAFTIELSLHQQLSSMSFAISEFYKIEKEKKQPFAFCSNLLDRIIGTTTLSHISCIQQLS